MVAGGRTLPKTIGNDPMREEMQKIREIHARKQKYDYSHVFRRKTRFELIRLCCIILGIEFAYAAETAFVSPILLSIGIEHKLMTLVWGLSPIFGFFMAPLLGSISDRCKLNIGRRRPLIIILSLGLIAGLILVPYGKDIGYYLNDLFNDKNHMYSEHLTSVQSARITSTIIVDDIFDVNQLNQTISVSYNTINKMNNYHIDDIDDTDYNKNKTSDNFIYNERNNGYKWAIIITIIGTILLDFDADTCQTPSRAYLLDVLVPEDHAKGLSTFTIMAGVGGFLGYSVGGINWENTEIGLFFGGNYKTVFVIVSIVFLLSVLCTVTSFREIPLRLIEKDELLRPVTQAQIKKELTQNNNPIYVIKESTSIPVTVIPVLVKYNNNNFGKNIEITENGLNIRSKDNNYSNDDDDDEDDEDDNIVTLRQYLKSIIFMPKSLRILCFTNCLCWTSHVCYCLYFTDFVGEEVFGGDPSAYHGSYEHNLYEEGVRFGCWGMAIYALSCSFYSMIIERLIKRFRAKYVYVGGLLGFGFSMLILAYWPSKIGVLTLSVAAGIVYATLFTMPFILVARYHSKGCFKISKGENIELTQRRGLGTDIAIVHSMIFVAQIAISLTIGTLIEWFATTCVVIYAASILSLCAGIAATQILYLDI